MGKQALENAKKPFCHERQNIGYPALLDRCEQHQSCEGHILDYEISKILCSRYANCM